MPLLKLSYMPICILFIVICSLSIVLPQASLALSGRDIALKVDQVDKSKTSIAAMIMVIKRGEQQLVRQISMSKKKFNDSEKQHIRFVEPSDIRNTVYLTWVYKDIKKDDDMWVYLPAESLVRRISGGGKKGSFMRSDYAIEDISRREVDEDTYTLLKDENIFGIDCSVLEAVPLIQKDTQYSKRVIWVRKDIWLPAKIDFYNQSGILFKELIFGGYKNIAGIWTATRQRMRTKNTKSETIMEMRDILYNTPVSDDIFSAQNLKR